MEGHEEVLEDNEVEVMMVVVGMGVVVMVEVGR